MKLAVLSHYQAKELVNAQRKGMGSVNISLDLGLSSTQIPLDTQGLLLPDGKVLQWGDVEEIAKSTSSCYVIEDGAPRAIQF